MRVRTSNRIAVVMLVMMVVTAGCADGDAPESKGIAEQDVRLQNCWIETINT